MHLRTFLHALLLQQSHKSFTVMQIKYQPGKRDLSSLPDNISKATHFDIYYVKVTFQGHIFQKGFSCLDVAVAWRDRVQCSAESRNEVKVRPFATR